MNLLVKLLSFRHSWTSIMIWIMWSSALWHKVVWCIVWGAHCLQTCTLRLNVVVTQKTTECIFILQGGYIYIYTHTHTYILWDVVPCNLVEICENPCLQVIPWRIFFSSVWRWRQQFHLKQWYLYSKLHGIASQNVIYSSGNPI
jgi:hypothetical protein